MTPEDYAFVAELCAARAGLRVDVDKTYLIESRLAPAARREGFGSVGELAAALRDPLTDERIVAGAVEAMAPGDTRFFRDRGVFERLWREVVPDLARRRNDVIRVWSAGCAAGQEIYSLAMLQAEAPAPTGKVELFASDLSARQLDRARSGLYSSFEVQRGLSARELVRHFENRDDKFQLQRPLRQAVRWRQVNLLEDLSPLGRFEVVLCRYLLCGLTDAARERVADSLASVLAVDGVLVLGEGETLASPKFSPLPGVSGVFTRARDVSAAA